MAIGSPIYWEPYIIVRPKEKQISGALSIVEPDEKSGMLSIADDYGMLSIK